jgi:hypothetical protein
MSLLSRSSIFRQGQGSGVALLLPASQTHYLDSLSRDASNAPVQQTLKIWFS